MVTMKSVMAWPLRSALCWRRHHGRAYAADTLVQVIGFGSGYDSLAFAVDGRAVVWRENEISVYDQDLVWLGAFPVDPGIEVMAVFDREVFLFREDLSVDQGLEVEVIPLSEQVPEASPQSYTQERAARDANAILSLDGRFHIYSANRGDELIFPHGSTRATERVDRKVSKCKEPPDCLENSPAQRPSEPRSEGARVHCGVVRGSIALLGVGLKRYSGSV